MNCVSKKNPRWSPMHDIVKHWEPKGKLIKKSFSTNMIEHKLDIKYHYMKMV